MSAETHSFYEFGPFRLDTVRRLLLREGQPVPLTSKVFDTLEVLVRNHDRVLEKDELIRTIWPDSFVEEANLAQNVSTLRKALGETAGEHRYIATIPGRGYRFVGDVRAPFSAGTDIVLERHTTAELAIQQEVEVGVQVVRTRSVRPWIAGSAVGLIALAAIAPFVWRHYWTREDGRPRTMAVLPFQQLIAAPGDEYLGVGLADAVITRLSNIGELAVRPTSSVLKYAGAAGADPLTAGRELHVDALLDGKLQKSGSRLRVTVQLIRVADGRPLWAETFDEDAAGLFAIEDSVSAKVSGALALRLGASERRELTRRQTENGEAYRNYLQGRYSTFRFTRDGLSRAIQFFNRAIALDPGYALAYAGLADAYTTASDWVLPPREALPKAVAASRRALSFDDHLAEAHASLGHALMHQWHLSEAGAEFGKALALNPRNTSIYFAYSEYLSALGQEDQSVAELKKALRIDPLSAEIMAMMGWPLYLKNDYEGSLAAEDEAIAVDPGFWLPRMQRAYDLMLLRRYPEAVAEFGKARQFNSDSTLTLSGMGAALGEWGKREDALRVLAELKQLSAQQYVSPVDLALVQAALGQREEAIASLNRGWDDQSEMMLFLKIYAPFGGLGTDPRFQELVRRVRESR